MAAYKGWVEFPHGEARYADMPPKGLAAAHQHDSAVQMMRPAGQSQQMPARILHIAGLVEYPVAERQRLIAAKHQRTRMVLADVDCLGLGQDLSHLLWRRAASLQR